MNATSGFGSLEQIQDTLKFLGGTILNSEKSSLHYQWHSSKETSNYVKQYRWAWEEYVLMEYIYDLCSCIYNHRILLHQDIYTISTGKWKLIKNKTYCSSIASIRKIVCYKEMCIFYIYQALSTEYMLHNRFKYEKSQAKINHTPTQERNESCFGFFNCTTVLNV